MVGEGGQRLVAEHRTRTLQGVQSAEYPGDKFAVFRIVLKVEQALLNLFEEFLRFNTENFRRIRNTHLARTLSTIFDS